MSELYYTPPTKATQEQFDELKAKAIELWKEVDKDNDKYGYASEKINKIKDLENVGDNFIYMVAMYDSINQLLLAGRLSPETKQAVADMIKDGGTPDFLNPFLLKGVLTKV